MSAAALTLALTPRGHLLLTEADNGIPAPAELAQPIRQAFARSTGHKCVEEKNRSSETARGRTQESRYQETSRPKNRRKKDRRQKSVWEEITGHKKIAGCTQGSAPQCITWAVSNVPGGAAVSCKQSETLVYQGFAAGGSGSK